MYKKFIKRILDFIFSLILIIILSPLMLILYILTIINSGFPGIFKQLRPGKNEKIFKLYKFRTMNNKRDPVGNLLPDKDRITKFGRFLRKTSLDELPELFNILKGDMSFVGPRPLLVEYLEYYNDEQRMRHTVTPGLTGLAQINGRNSISWEEKFTFDKVYVEHISFIEDLRIFLGTIKKVLSREGINTDNDEAMPLFRGTKIVKKVDKFKKTKEELEKEKELEEEKKEIEEERQNESSIDNDIRRLENLERKKEEDRALIK